MELSKYQTEKIDKEKKLKCLFNIQREIHVYLIYREREKIYVK